MGCFYYITLVTILDYLLLLLWNIVVLHEWFWLQSLGDRDHTSMTNGESKNQKKDQPKSSRYRKEEWPRCEITDKLWFQKRLQSVTEWFLKWPIEFWYLKPLAKSLIIRLSHSSVERISSGHLLPFTSRSLEQRLSSFDFILWRRSHLRQQPGHQCHCTIWRNSTPQLQSTQHQGRRQPGEWTRLLQILNPWKKFGNVHIASGL